MSLSHKERADELVRAAQEVKAEEVVLYNVTGKSPITDYVLICQGRSQGHVKGISDQIRKQLNEKETRAISVEGYNEGSWILMDYDEVIVHIFHPETRAYYRLDALHQNDEKETFASEDELVG